MPSNIAVITNTLPPSTLGDRRNTRISCLVTFVSLCCYPVTFLAGCECFNVCGWCKQLKEVGGRISGEKTMKCLTENLTDELKQREEEAAEAQQEADVKLLEAKKLASQYQKEADKCSSGMDTCEEAQEKSADSLLGQKKLTALWEERARELGCKPVKPKQNQ